MEPVTFFTGLGVTTVGYAWWMVTNREYEYANIYDFFLERKKLERYISVLLSLITYMNYAYTTEVHVYTAAHKVALSVHLTMQQAAASRCDRAL
jgi:Mitochondrial calcium uniporter